MEVLNVVMRVVHIGSAIGLLGGTLFMLAALLPASGALDEEPRGSIRDLARRRFYRIAHPAILLLLISGGYNFAIQLDAYAEAGPITHGLLGIKIILALIIFAIVFAQTFGMLRERPGRWLAVNVSLGLLIIILAAIVRHVRLDATTLTTG